MTILAIIVALLLAFVAFKFIKGMIKFALLAAILDALAAGKSPKPGPQVDRQTSCPMGGPTTLKKMAERNYDYRPQWMPTAGPVKEGAQ